MSATVVGMFLERCAATPEAVAFRYRPDGAGGEWASITWGGYGTLVRRAADGLRALGVTAADKVAILSGNRYEWHVADIATQATGGATVPIYPTNAPTQVQYIAAHSESAVIVCENATQVAKVLQRRADLPALRAIVVLEPDGVELTNDVIAWERLLELGDEFAAANPNDFDTSTQAIMPDDLATLVYTSGTTGPPKGAMLLHKNITWTCAALTQVLEFGPGDRRVSYLPLCHIAERMTSHFLQIFQGTETWFATSIETLRDDLVACKPSNFFAVPRVWEKFYAGINAMIAGLPDEQRDMAEQAIALGMKRVEAQQAGTSLPSELEEKYQEADASLFALARAALGLNEARALVSGAAPINPEVLKFFHAIGLPIGEVYGQTEDCGPTTINRTDDVRLGTVGKTLEGLQVKIAGDGEILVKGGNVGPGYFKDPLATAELIDAKGWMHSGDIGTVDADGFLRITDRKKDLIITAAGKNIAPQVIENMLKYSPWISQAVVIGDARPYLVALLTLDQDTVTAFASQQGIAFTEFAELVRHPDVVRLVDDAVGEVNANLAKVEQLKKWHVLDRDFQQDEDEVTPTLKVRRKAIIDKNADLIEDLYSSSAVT